MKRHDDGARDVLLEGLALKVGEVERRIAPAYEQVKALANELRRITANIDDALAEVALIRKALGEPAATTRIKR